MHHTAPTQSIVTRRTAPRRVDPSAAAAASDRSALTAAAVPAEGRPAQTLSRPVLHLHHGQNTHPTQR